MRGANGEHLGVGDPAMLRSRRRDRGAYYTPTTLARSITATAVAQCRQSTLRAAALKFFDPACGNGQFLVSYFRHQYRAASAGLGRHDRSEFALQVLEQMHGMDIDPVAVEQSRRRLARLAAGRHTAAFDRAYAVTEQRIVCADALVPATWPHSVRRALEGLPLVVTNPPFINIRRVTRIRAAEYKRLLAREYHCARGAYDQFVLFIELSTRLLADGGVAAWIVPNTWETAEYAAACRQLLSQQGTLHAVSDLAAAVPFTDARIYPHVLFWQKGIQQASARYGSTPHQPATRITLPWYEALSEHPAAVPLGEVATLHSGATGFTAQRLAGALMEHDEHPSSHHSCYPFIVTGSIDRYCVLERPVRFMGRCLQRPCIAQDEEQLSAVKRQLYGQPKLVLAGLTKRLEAVYLCSGCALGVQTFAAVPRSQSEAWLLLGLLNSKLLTFLYRKANRAKIMGGGYIALNKRPLTALPIITRAPGAPHRDLLRSIRRGARWLSACSHPANAAMLRRFQRIDAHVDRAVYRLYGLSELQQREVEMEIDRLQKTT